MTDPIRVPRVGLGFDVHPRASGRVLMLGGLRWEGEDGLAGHSDGDAVCHALADALLGACASGDVGQHFPESDPELEGIAGPDLLARTLTIVRAAGFLPTSCDLTIICLHPAIGPRRDDIRRLLASALALDVSSVSVKATRPEGLGLHGDGIGCMAVAVVVSTDDTSTR
ncbi:MAG TPA: 2-C-methyl-D-erythritol 2,4-cyclodiphosphate synthase [Actinomycetota bacterium]